MLANCEILCFVHSSLVKPERNVFLKIKVHTNTTHRLQRCTIRLNDQFLKSMTWNVTRDKKWQQRQHGQTSLTVSSAFSSSFVAGSSAFSSSSFKGSSFAFSSCVSSDFTGAASTFCAFFFSTVPSTDFSSSDSLFSSSSSPSPGTFSKLSSTSSE